MREKRRENEIAESDGGQTAVSGRDSVAEFTGFDWSRKMAWRSTSAEPCKREWANIPRLREENGSILSQWSDGSESKIAMFPEDFAKLKEAYYASDAKGPFVLDDDSKLYVHTKSKGAEWVAFHRPVGKKQVQIDSVHSKHFASSGAAEIFMRDLAAAAARKEFPLASIKEERKKRMETIGIITSSKSPSDSSKKRPPAPPSEFTASSIAAQPPKKKAAAASKEADAGAQALADAEEADVDAQLEDWSSGELVGSILGVAPPPGILMRETQTK